MDFLQQYPMYVVLVTALMIWAGLAWYINRIDTKVRDLERRFER